MGVRDCAELVLEWTLPVDYHAGVVDIGLHRIGLSPEVVPGCRVGNIRKIGAARQTLRGGM